MPGRIVILAVKSKHLDVNSLTPRPTTQTTGTAASPHPYFRQIQTTIGIHHQGVSHAQIHEPMKRMAYTTMNRATSTRISDRVAAPGAENSMSTTGNSSVRSWITAW